MNKLVITSEMSIEDINQRFIELLKEYCNHTTTRSREGFEKWLKSHNPKLDLHFYTCYVSTATITIITDEYRVVVYGDFRFLPKSDRPKFNMKEGKVSRKYTIYSFRNFSYFTKKDFSCSEEFINTTQKIKELFNEEDFGDEALYTKFINHYNLFKFELAANCILNDFEHPLNEPLDREKVKKFIKDHYVAIPNNTEFNDYRSPLVYIDEITPDIESKLRKITELGYGKINARYLNESDGQYHYRFNLIGDIYGVMSFNVERLVIKPEYITQQNFSEAFEKADNVTFKI